MAIRGCFEPNATDLDRWLCLSVDKNVSMLVLKTDIMSPLGYSVPHQIFVAQTMKRLDLSKCTLVEDRIAHIDLPRLEKLWLTQCWILGDNLLQNMVCASPNNKHLLISRCTGAQVQCSLSVSKLRRLEVLDLSGCSLKEHPFAGIELPCLKKLFFVRCHFEGDNLLQKILCACGPNAIHISISWCTGIGPSLSVSCKPLLKCVF